ncbi:MAG: diguanylate cyclase [Magnetococcales bacterium]|nr:diguanylate cyclase [Magnetococcales bacterium]
MRGLRFSQWSILAKILFISCLSISVLLMIVFLYFIPNIQTRIVDEKRIGMQQVVEVAYGIVHFFHQEFTQGVLEEEQAKKLAIEALRRIRYREKEYFWINDTRPVMVMHPNFPELEGKSLNDYADPHGKRLFMAFVDVVNLKGQGFVEYHWPKPGGKEPMPKMSFVKGFTPWGWVIGSGIYMDDVATEIREMRLISMSGVTLFAVLTLLLALLVGRGITHRLSKVIVGLKEIASGHGNVDIRKRISITSIDEIGVLSNEFNELMESIARLNHFKKVIEEDDSLEDVYTRLWETFHLSLDLTQCLIYEVDVMNHTMRVVYPPDVEESLLPCNAEILVNCELCKAKKSGHEVGSMDFPRICRQFLLFDSHDHVCLPMSIGGSTVGLVQFVMKKADMHVDRQNQIDGMFKVEQYLKESLPVIESKRLLQTLRESALRDPLTGLHNRRFLQECIDGVCFGAVRRHKSLGVMMCDLDHFKQVNDTHGHGAGDAVLKALAKVIRETVRAADLVIRFGGEEFLVVLVDIDPGETERLAEKVLRNVAACEFRISNGRILRKTISIGYGEFPGDAEQFWTVLKSADVALYHSKTTGRNRATRADAEMLLAAEQSGKPGEKSESAEHQAARP